MQPCRHTEGILLGGTFSTARSWSSASKYLSSRRVFPAEKSSATCAWGFRRCDALSYKPYNLFIRWWERRTRSRPGVVLGQLPEQLGQARAMPSSAILLRFTDRASNSEAQKRRRPNSNDPAWCWVAADNRKGAFCFEAAGVLAQMASTGTHQRGEPQPADRCQGPCLRLLKPPRAPQPGQSLLERYGPDGPDGNLGCIQASTETVKA